jgi:hypothetical protein
MTSDITEVVLKHLYNNNATVNVIELNDVLVPLNMPANKVSSALTIMENHKWILWDQNFGIPLGVTSAGIMVTLDDYVVRALILPEGIKHYENYFLRNKKKSALLKLWEFISQNALIAAVLAGIILIYINQNGYCGKEKTKEPTESKLRSGSITESLGVDTFNKNTLDSTKADTTKKKNKNQK